MYDVIFETTTALFPQKNMVELTHDNIAEVESRYFHDSPLGLFRQYRYQLNRRISRCCARIIFQRGLTGGLFAGSTQSKQCRIELLYRYKRAKTNKITVLNFRKIYLYFNVKILMEKPILLACNIFRIRNNKVVKSTHIYIYIYLHHLQNEI